MDNKLLKINNGQKIKLADIPHFSFDEFYEEILSLALNDYYIVHYFAYEDKGKIRLVAVLRRKNWLFVGISDTPEKYPALTCKCTKFHMFEREIAEQFAIKPVGHPWLKSVRYHANYLGKEDIFGNDYSEDIPGRYEYYSVEGEEIHEVAVGPVHAGIIEPGHFRFNCAGEKVLHLEIQLGYQHRGIEKQILNANKKQLPVIIESIAGDTAVANSLCFSEAVEALANIQVGMEAKKIRGLALELERIANHIGDLGALSGDIAFLPPASYYGRIRGEFLNMLLAICGNRFGKGLIRPGGIRFSITDKQKEEFVNRIKKLKSEIVHIGDMLFNQAGVLGRFESTGIVGTEIAQQLGLVGPAARASGILYDARYDLPAGVYQEIPLKVVTEHTGDVMARALVRYNEALQSLDIVETLLTELENNNSYKHTEFELEPDNFVVTVHEGWRGELSHCIITDSKGDILRYKIKDPSFHNWMGLAIAMRNEDISDFPLCNKSFNLSYCGFDL
ncbi:hydrogenase [Deferribacter autotrophicus]|uniref:Hydrogenase n=1 Tax=Deferribacter autotrophicus TaxID=500465 RepID=A0A5A8F674_9BACT|nr:hydrogenase [Deferribacter autotrophicus]KAA0258244.1 hydrogenase [Deferribacter autotrophicus]